MRMWKRLFRRKERKRQPLCSLVLVAAGSASRMEGEDKILYELGGIPVMIHSLRPFEASPMIREIVIVTRREIILEIGELCKRYGLSKVTKIMPGGASRTESVRIGLDEIKQDSDLVAIHDGARPFVSQAILEETIAAAAEYGAAAPGIPSKDTIKVVQEGIVRETLPRETLCAVQTPQVFEMFLIRAALTKAWQDGAVLTDDCSAVERLGFPVVMTQGDEENIKLTTPNDLLLGEYILAGRECV